MSQTSYPRNSILLLVAVVQAAIGIVLFIGHAAHLDADFKVAGLVDAIVTIVSALALGGMFYLSASEPFMAAWISVAIYLGVVVTYAATAHNAVPNIVHGNWGMWVGILNLAVLGILIQGVVAEREGARVIEGRD